MTDDTNPSDPSAEIDAPHDGVGSTDRRPPIDPDPDPDSDRDGDLEATPCAYTEYVERGEVAGLPATGEGATGLERAVWDALYEVEDPEMPVSIVDLGLVYGIELEDSSGRGDGLAADDGVHVRVIMTLTYTGCPARKMLTEEIEEAAGSPDGVDTAEVELVWSPEWSLDMVTDQGKDDLREFGLSV